MINKFVKSQPQERLLSLLLSIGLIAAFLLPANLVSAVGPNLALNRPVTASSIEGTGFEAAKAVDGNAATRWASVEPATSAQWIYVDLGATTAIGQVILKWEAAYATSYQIQTSDDAVNWTSIYTTTTGNGATDDLTVSGSGRYVRVYMTVRGTAWGYSLWEFEVYGPGAATATNTPVGPTATKTNTPVGPTATNTSAPSSNLALNRPATASSIEGPGFEAAKAVDGNASTRWASVEPATSAQWIYVDLGASSTVARVVLNWEAAYATSYQVQTSSDAVNWSSPIYSTTTGNGGIDDLTVSGSGRYVRVYMTVRGTAYGYSLWAFEVYGTGGATATNTAVGPTATKTNTPVGPTATRTNTPVSPTATRTRTPTATTPSTTHPANELWDDFSYTGPSDGNLTGMGWVARNEPNSGPGPSGADFVPGNISFVNDPSLSGNKLMQMRVVTSGTGASTTQSELYTGTRKFLEGTYAARMYFTDAPISGSYDGDEIVETFFSITPLNFPMDPAYSENDFEYLANGGWGQSGPTMWNTTWETYQPDPWVKDGISDFRSGSIQGWHTLVMTVANGHVIYYMDGVQLADHSGKYYPETMMSINFNIWIIPEFFGGPTTSRTWQQQVDWVYFARNTVLTQAQVNALVADFRAQSVARKDNVP